MTEKVIRDGMVAVLVSPGYGAGWSTWSSRSEAMMFCPELVHAVLNKAPLASLEEIARRLFPDEYHGGLRDIEVEWVKEGTQFTIDEYDGSETLRYASKHDWVTA